MYKKNADGPFVDVDNPQYLERQAVITTILENIQYPWRALIQSYDQTASKEHLSQAQDYLADAERLQAHGHEDEAQRLIAKAQEHTDAAQVSKWSEYEMYVARICPSYVKYKAEQAAAEQLQEDIGTVSVVNSMNESNDSLDSHRSFGSDDDSDDIADDTIITDHEHADWVIVESTEIGDNYTKSLKVAGEAFDFNADGILGNL